MINRGGRISVTIARLYAFTPLGHRQSVKNYVKSKSKAQPILPVNAWALVHGKII